MDRIDTLRYRASELLKNDYNRVGETDLWKTFRGDILHQLLSADPSSFCQWKTIKKTMFHNGVMVSPELNFLKSYKWEVWKNVLSEDGVGSPQPSSVLEHSSGNLIHGVYHVSQLFSKFNIPIDRIKNIVEFGGGYGNMCRIFYKLGFKGNYIIYDFPELNILQEYFLSQLAYTPPISYGYVGEKNISLISDIELFPESFNSDGLNIFIATWSISECGIEFRDKVVSRLGDIDYFLIAYQKNFEGIDNIKYFKDSIMDKEGYYWVNYEISHGLGNYYLLGKKL